MPLTDVACRNAKPSERQRKLADEKGLYLLVNQAGKYWRMDYRFGGKRKTMALGVYPATTLTQARAKRDEARARLAAGEDPMAEKKRGKLLARLATATTFEGIAGEWFDRASEGWVDSHAERIRRRLERDVFPWIGSRPVAEITLPELLAVFQRIQERGAIETAHRAKWDCSQVFKYAIGTGRATRNPIDDIADVALKTPASRVHAALVEPAEVGALMRSIATYGGSLVTRSALRLAALTFIRPGELRFAKWPEFDLSAAVWEIPSERMKRPKADKMLSGAHIVPLSRQAVEVLQTLQPLTGPDGYVFPSARAGGRPMSNNAVLAALRRMGYTGDEMTGHGFRATARTLIAERLKIDERFIELQLAHAVRDSNGRSYNRTEFLPERTEMMQRWADYLDTLAAGAKIVPINEAA